MANEDTKDNENQPQTENKEKAPEQPTYVTAKELNETLNKALTAREKRLMRDFEAILARAQTAKAEAKAEDATEEATEESEEEEAPAPSKKPLSSAEIAARKALAKATAMEKRAKAAEEQAAKEKSEALAKEERSLVMKESGRIARSADGDVIFKMPREAGGEKYDDEMPLEAGIREWLETDEGKAFAPPKGVEGSGASASRGGNRDLRTMSKAERKAAAGRMLLDFALGRGR
jgi:hypothetical protein